MSDPKDFTKGWAPEGIFGWDGEGPAPPDWNVDRLAEAMKAAHVKLWDRRGQRRPEATDDDHAAWVEASARWQAAHDRKWGRGPDA